MNIRNRRRAVGAAAIAILLVAAGCSGSGTRTGASKLSPSTTNQSPSSSSAPVPQASTLRWRSCQGGLECATLSVPRDWSNPSGQHYSLFVVRKPATDSAHRIGSVFFNFGGPGEAGGSQFNDYLTQTFDSSARQLNKRFDLVSWDPRGAGRSAGIDCTTVDKALQPDPDPTPETQPEIAALRAHVVDQTNTCLAKAGPELPYVDTWSTVRDLEALRQAVGDSKLTYVGYSYGTELGMDYLATYPTHVRAMVLDGVDLPKDPVTAGHDQAVGFEHAIDAFLANCQAEGSKCGFGNGQPRAALLAFLNELQAGRRIPAGGDCSAAPGLPSRPGSVGIGEALTALALALYQRDLWPVLESGLAEASAPTSPDASCLLGMRDYYEGFQPEGGFTNMLDAFMTISCADQVERSQNPIGDHPELVTAWSKELPIFGADFATQLPGCWHFPPARHPLSPFTASEFSKAPPVALVGNTGDPATPYSHAVAASRLLPGSVLLTWESTEHTVYLSHDSSCIDDPLTTYLMTLRMPKSGIRCKP